MLSLNSHTPTLTVTDPRSLPVRSVKYLRSTAGQAAQAHIDRTAHDAVGRATARWDPRLQSVQKDDPQVPANLNILHSLGGQVLLIQSVDAGWDVQLFGEAGQGVQFWNGRGSQRRVVFDALLRPVAIIENSACTERFAYGMAEPTAAERNQCGRVVRQDDPAGTRHFDYYGVAGEPIAQTQRYLQSLDMPDWPLPFDERDNLLEQAAGARSTLQFNPVGNVLEQTDAQGNRQRFNHTIDGRLREAWLQLKNATAAQRLVHDIHYNAQGQIEQQTAGNQVTSRFDYCPKDGRLNRLSAAGPSDEPLQDLHYVYDPVGNILSLEDKALPVRFFANQRIEPINRYTYDSLYQLIEATGWEAGSANRGPAHLEDPAAVANYRQTYRYDAGGNLLELIHHGPQQHGRVLTAAKHSNRCLPEVGGRPPTEAEIAEAFDASGNLLMLDRGRTLSWDARNQLSHVHMVERTLRLNDTERYVYGADGMRQRKVRTTQTNARTLFSETRYLPGLETRDGDGEKLHVVTVQAGRTTVQVLHWEGAAPQQLANDQYRYTLSDHLGSCSLELDSEARIISRETYHPFGTTAFTQKGDSSEESYRTLRYSGKERDATGLYYYGFRYYVPWLQRWSNPDPAGEVDGLNRYEMVRNNPVTFTDILGLSPTVWFTYVDGQERALSDNELRAAFSDGTPKIIFSGDGHASPSFAYASDIPDVMAANRNGALSLYVEATPTDAAIKVEKFIPEFIDKNKSAVIGWEPEELSTSMLELFIIAMDHSESSVISSGAVLDDVEMLGAKVTSQLFMQAEELAKEFSLVISDFTKPEGYPESTVERLRTITSSVWRDEFINPYLAEKVGVEASANNDRTFMVSVGFAHLDVRYNPVQQILNEIRETHGFQQRIFFNRSNNPIVVKAEQ
ncbi:RHS repeat domain-containing protein [Pseudomonas carnis]|uniref:RHS repeat domain-containing protein n=1 Tax=Pseudomonas carnis TaxID=2487355 RepID=UPI001BC97AE8|nr:RHS repeat-associated core domain-containing protein [Pseudomonas carnis]